MESSSDDEEKPSGKKAVVAAAPKEQSGSAPIQNIDKLAADGQKMSAPQFLVEKRKLTTCLQEGLGPESDHATTPSPLVELEELQGQLKEDHEVQSLDVPELKKTYNIAVDIVKAIIASSRATKQVDWLATVDKARDAIGSFNQRAQEMTQMLEAFRHVYAIYKANLDKATRHAGYLKKQVGVLVEVHPGRFGISRVEKTVGNE